jgi:hypothetical protein
MGRLRDKIKTDPDAGLHTLRRTFLTEAGEYTDAFALQYIAGHDTIKTRCGMCTLGRSQSAGRSGGSIGRRSRRSCETCIQKRMQSTLGED